MGIINISIIGASGRMGMAIVEESKKIPNFKIKYLVEAKGHESVGSALDNVIVTDRVEKSIKESDVIIDFSSPKSTLNLMKSINKKDTPALVIGTTGFTKKQEEEFERVKRGLKVLRASNMSIGVNLMFNLTKQLTKILPDDANVEILDTHHKLKKDTPSGTSLSLEKKLRVEKKWKKFQI